MENMMQNYAESESTTVQRLVISPRMLLIIQVTLFVFVTSLIFLQVFDFIQVQIDSTTVALLVVLLVVTLLHRIHRLDLGLGGASFGIEMSKVADKAGLINMPERAKEIQTNSDALSRELLSIYDSILTNLSDNPIEALRDMRHQLRELLLDVCGYDHIEETSLGRDLVTQPDGGGHGFESADYGGQSQTNSRQLGRVELDIIYDVLYIVDISIYAYKRGDIRTSELRSTFELWKTAVTFLEAERESPEKSEVDISEEDKSPTGITTESEKTVTETPIGVQWRLVGSIKRVLEDFDETEEITASTLANRIMNKRFVGYLVEGHPERFIVNNNAIKKTTGKWLTEVQTLFDPTAFGNNMLDGDHVIFGLSLLDEDLRRELQRLELLVGLEKYLVEQLLSKEGQDLHHSID